MFVMWWKFNGTTVYSRARVRAFLTEDPTYSTESDPERLSFLSEMRSLPVPGGSAARAEVASEGLVPVGAGGHSPFNGGWRSGVSADIRRRRYGDQRQGETALPGTAAEEFPPHSQTVPERNRPPASLCQPRAGGFPVYGAFRSHRKASDRKRKYVCQHCGKGFPRPKELQIHLRVHTGERPYGCTQCGKRFTQSCNLKAHLSVHTGEKPFTCAECGRNFTRCSHLKRHQRTHSARTPAQSQAFLLKISP